MQYITKPKEGMKGQFNFMLVYIKRNIQYYEQMKYNQTKQIRVGLKL